jgi:hypothetical protein
MASTWNTTQPPKRILKPVRLRYQYQSLRPQTGLWDKRENAFSLITVGEDPDGLALYPEDGWKILGWKNP